MASPLSYMNTITPFKGDIVKLAREIPNIRNFPSNVIYSYKCYRYDYKNPIECYVAFINSVWYTQSVYGELIQMPAFESVRSSKLIDDIRLDLNRCLNTYFDSRWK